MKCKINAFENWKSNLEKRKLKRYVKYILMAIGPSQRFSDGRDGMIINEKRVLRILRKLQLLVTSFHHKSRKYNSYRGCVGKIAKHLIRRRFETMIFHQKITADTTEFKYYDNGNINKAYLDPFLDLFNREVISFSVTKHPIAQSIMHALNQVIDITSDCSFRRTFNSDQDWAYQMHQYTDKLKAHRIF